MAKYYIIENLEDAEEKIINELESYFHNDVRLPKLFPNFGTVRVSSIHPFAILNIAKINGTKEPGNLFPGITVSIVEEPTGPPMANFESEIVEIDLEWCDEQADNELVDQDQITDIRDAIIGAGQNLWGVKITDRRGFRLVKAIWSENKTIKEFLYQHVRSFVHVKRDILTDLDLREWAITGTPSGLYNLEYGRILYGAEVALAGSRQVTSVTVDTEWTTVAHVNMYVENINP